jgi:ATP-binding cassette, subfamily B, bacterial
MVEIRGWRGLFGPNTRRVLRYLRLVRLRLWAIAGLAVLIVPLSLVEPYLMIYLFDRVLLAQRPDLLLHLAVMVAPFLLLGAVTEFLLAYTLLDMSRVLHKRIKALQLDNLLGKSSSFFRNTATGRVLFSFFNDSNQIGSVLSVGLVNAVLHLFFIIVRLGILWYIDLTLLLAYLLVIPVQGFVLYRVMKVAMRLEIDLKRRDEELTSRIEEMLRGSLVVKAFGFGAPLASIWNRVFGARLDVDFKNAMYKQVGTLAFVNIQLFGAFLVLFLGVHQIAEGVLTVGTLLAFTTVAGRVTPSLQALVGFLVGGQEILVNIERFYRIYDLPGEGDEFVRPGEAAAPARSNGALRDEHLREVQLRHVGIEYGGGARIVVPCDFSMRVGDQVLWYGANGTGKTSMAMALAGLLPHSPGSIRCSGEALCEFSPESVRERVLYVGGEPFWPERTLRENFADRDGGELDPDWLLQCLWVSCAADVVDSLPKGMETVLSSDGHILSRGENQRLFLAMALYRRPKLMILDETLANVSPQLLRSILERIREPMRGGLLVHISQRTDHFELCNRRLAFGPLG